MLHDHSGCHLLDAQGNQDGILAAIFKQIGTENKFFVEFGFGYTCTQSQIEQKTCPLSTMSEKDRGKALENDYSKKTNTYQLFKNGWTGRLFDDKWAHPGIGLVKELLTPDTIVSKFEQNNVPHNVDYVSLDIDSTDLWVFKALVAPSSPYRPRVMTLEYNANFPVWAAVTVDDEWAAWDDSFVFGTSIGAILIVAREAGYEPVYIEGGLDVFLVRSDILRNHGTPSAPGRGYFDQELAVRFPFPNVAGKRNCETSKVQKFIDYATYAASGGNMELARRAAVVTLQRAQAAYNISYCLPRTAETGPAQLG